MESSTEVRNAFCSHLTLDLPHPGRGICAHPPLLPPPGRLGPDVQM